MAAPRAATAAVSSDHPSTRLSGLVLLLSGPPPRARTCVLNPATAPCQLRGTADDPLVTPDIDDCRPQCPNLARTDRDIAYNEQQVAELKETLSNSLAPPIRHARERHELARLQAILDAHHQNQKPIC